MRKHNTKLNIDRIIFIGPKWITIDAKIYF